MKNIIFGSDYRGIELRESLVKYAQSQGLSYKDIGIPEGSPLDYVDISRQMVSEVQDSDVYGVLICGSGQGVNIYANRSSNIRAAVCHTPEEAESVRSKLNANVLCLGSKTTSLEEAVKIIEVFINTPFHSEKHGKYAAKLGTNATTHTYSGVNLIARAIIIHNDHVLFTTVTPSNREFASDLFFLPGGHVDYKESAVDAMRREIKEEMEIDVGEITFMGALECSWDRKGRVYHELNLVYKVEISGLDLEHPPVAVDPVHQFVWRPISEVAQLKILPEKLKPIILNAVKSDKIESLFLSQMLNDKAA